MRLMIENGPGCCHEMSMAAYSNVDQVSASLQYGNTGPEGWGFHLWSDLREDKRRTGIC